MKTRDPAAFIITVAAAQLLFYLYSAFLSGSSNYGFNQMRHSGPTTVIALLLAFAGLSYMVRRSILPAGEIPKEIPVWRSPWTYLTAAAGLAVFLLLKTGFMNDDGLQNAFALQAGIYRIRMDEILTGVILESVWRAWGNPASFNPFDVFASFSAVMGFVFILAATGFARREMGGRWLLFVVLLVSGGFMQGFFGDVENYAGVMAISMAYIWSAREFLKGRVSILTPGLVFGAAVSMHLLALCMAPAHLLLLFTAWRRKGRILASASIAVTAVCILMVFLTAAEMSLDIRNLGNSHLLGSGTDRTTADMIAVPSATYFNAVTSVQYLLFPFWWVPVLLFLTGNIEMDRFDRFLITASAGFMLMAYLWKLSLGPYFDWNLLAAGAIPPSVLTWRNLLKPASAGLRTAVPLALAFMGLVHSGSWIASNHASFSMPRYDVMTELLEMEKSDGYVIPVEYRRHGNSEPEGASIERSHNAQNPAPRRIPDRHSLPCHRKTGMIPFRTAVGYPQKTAYMNGARAEP